MPKREIDSKTWMRIWYASVIMVVAGVLLNFLGYVVEGLALTLVGIFVGVSNNIMFDVKKPPTATKEEPAEETSLPENFRPAAETPALTSTIQTTAKCPKCGSPIPADAKYCPFCLTNLQTGESAANKAVCPNCKSNIPENIRFCPFCGTVLQQTKPSSSSDQEAAGTSDEMIPCSNCGRLMPSGGIMCPYCGTPRKK